MEAPAAVGDKEHNDSITGEPTDAADEAGADTAPEFAVALQKVIDAESSGDEAPSYLAVRNALTKELGTT